MGVAPEIPVLRVPGGTQNSSYTVSWSRSASSDYFDLQEYRNGTWSTVANNTTGTSKTRPVTWSVSSGAHDYQLQERVLVGNDWSSWQSYTIDGTSKQFVKSDGLYQFRVRGCKTFVCSSYSAAEMTEVRASGGGCVSGSGSPAEGMQAMPIDDTPATQSAGDSDVIMLAPPPPDC